jgi:hypothetical protein
MSKYKRAGLFNLKVNGQVYYAKGNFTYSLGGVKREAVLASNGQVIGYKEVAIVPYIEGEMSDDIGLNLKTLFNMDGATVSLELANGKVIVLREAWYAGESKVEVNEGNIAVRFEGLDCDEIK